MATEDELSGAQCINIVAAVQAGMAYADVATTLGVSPATVAALCDQCAEQGLMEWCIAQRQRSSAGTPRPVLPVDYATLPQFLIAAVSAVQARRLDVATAAATFNLIPAQLSTAVLKAQTLGFATWAAQVAATTTSAPANSLTRFSCEQKIAMVAALLSGARTIEQLSAAQGVQVKYLQAQLQRAHTLGLCQWCLKMRTMALKRPRSAQMLAFEAAHPVPVPDLAAIPAIRQDAVNVIKRQELTLEQVAMALALPAEQIASWMQADVPATQEDVPAAPEVPPVLFSCEGTRRITLLAGLLSGKYGKLVATATYFHVGRLTLKRIWDEAQAQGLFAWCAAQRQAERCEFDFDLSQVPVFKLAAAHAVLTQGYSAAEVAAVLGQSVATIEAWCTTAQEVGLATWAQEIAPEQRALVAPEFAPLPSAEQAGAGSADKRTASPGKKRGDHRRSTSGARSIAIVAYYLSGLKSSRELSQELGLTAARITALARAAQQQGLIVWCAEQRARDQIQEVTPELLAFEAAHPLPEPDWEQLPLFKIAAVETVRAKTMSITQVAQALQLQSSQVSAWCHAAQEQGFESWREAQQHQPQPPRNVRVVYSGRRRINMLAVLLSKEYGAIWAVALRFHVAYQTIRSQLIAARTKGLFNWCAQMRASDLKGGAKPESWEQEQCDPQIDYSTLPPFELCAVYTVLYQGKSVAEVATVLGLEPEQIEIWLKEAQEQGFVPWAQRFTIPERILVARALIPMLAQPDHDGTASVDSLTDAPDDSADPSGHGQ